MNYLLELTDYELEYLEESIYELEGDVYTSDPTRWLHESDYHLYYLSEVLTDYAPQTGFDALSMAQAAHRQEVARTVLEAMQEHLTEATEEGRQP